MWLFTTDSFVSIVEDKHDPSTLLVRGRMDEHVRSLFPDSSVETTASADYRFRSFVHREVVADTITKLVREINYPNFKNSIHDFVLHEACMEVWSVMRKLQTHPYSRYRKINEYR